MTIAQVLALLFSVLVVSVFFAAAAACLVLLVLWAIVAIRRLSVWRRRNELGKICS